MARMNSGGEGGPASQGDARDQRRRFDDGIRIEIQMHAERIAEINDLPDVHPCKPVAGDMIATHREAIARLRVHLPTIPTTALRIE